jgi:plasmid maintenance system antidote protein VapI
VHPGEILQEGFMKPLGLSMNKLALDLRAPVTRIDRSKPRQAAQG